MHARAHLPALGVAAITVAFATVCVRFVSQPSLASFADDSVSYLVMAQAFSPWQPAAPAVLEAFRADASYPPLFSLVLALAGAAHDVALAHALTGCMLALCLPLAYALGVRWLGSRRAALTAAASVALLPALWINAKGILSEPLYCLALLSSFCVLEFEREGRRRMLLLALALAAMALTRTAGLALVAAYALWALAARGTAGARLRALAPAAAGFVAYAAWVALRPAAGDVNVGLLGERLHEIDLARQAASMSEAWVGSLVLYWVQGRPLQPILAGVVGALALGGLASRAAAGKADAWMMSAYLATFLAWPFTDQMGRFIFPALPVLVLYAYVSACALARRVLGNPRAGLVVAAAILLVLCGPPLAFLYQRARIPAPQAAITDWYRTPDLREARERAGVHVGLLADMRSIEAVTGAGERVMWVTPAYIALLAGRRGMKSPSQRLDPAAFREAVRAASPDYLFVSRYHPRDTLSEQAWRVGVEAFYGRAQVVHAGVRPGSELVTSLLFRLKK